MSRDLHEGVDGPDVLQLERALARMGFAPGPVDGRYDAGTEAAVSNFYLRQGWAPFGPTDLQLEQLRTARTAAAQARDAHLQALNTIDQARTATPAEVEQARLDAVAARFLAALAGLTPMALWQAVPVIATVDPGYALLDVDDTIIEVHG